MDWHKDPALRRAHRNAMRASLEQFLNTRLASLYHMVRTGWWVLGKARVRVVECAPVPEREMRAFARAFRGALGRPKKRRIRSGEPSPNPRRRKT